MEVKSIEEQYAQFYNNQNEVKAIDDYENEYKVTIKEFDALISVEEQMGATVEIKNFQAIDLERLKAKVLDYLNKKFESKNILGYVKNIERLDDSYE